MYKTSSTSKPNYIDPNIPSLANIVFRSATQKEIVRNLKANGHQIGQQIDTSTPINIMQDAITRTILEVSREMDLQKKIESQYRDKLVKKFTTEYVFTQGIRQIEVCPFDMGKTLYVNQTAIDEDKEEFLLTPHEYIEPDSLFDCEYDALKAGIDILQNTIDKESEKIAQFEKMQDELKAQLRKFDDPTWDEDPAAW